ncbi:DUF4863 family protein [Trinickia acidisoli]|uniref:DUF4863 family protein n=1 Tax=Trinickia acidisoli TaxID=2767482 RepID=UPI001A8F4AB5|nr:DUF4863 family protein [Trinickia acidisoli]
MSPDELESLVAEVTERIAGRALDDTLDRWLNAQWPSGSSTYEALAQACRAGVDEGWLCNREAGGIRYGRIFKPTPRTHDFSVEVVQMEDLAGPHHVHPNGEIDLIMPLSERATFDGRAAGWCVYGPGSAHRPTVANGQALILYLLPQGAIDFTPVTAQ